MHIETPVGRFSYTDPDARWWWSDALYEIHGLHAGEVVPTLALMSRHVHPEDREGVVDLLRRQTAADEPFACQFRLLRLDGEERSVTLTGAREGTEVRGAMADVTEPEQRNVARAVNEHLERALRSRAVIDQAKGAFMLVYGIDEDEAFALLRWCSQHRNVRVALLAERVMTAAASVGGVAPALRSRLDELFTSSFEPAQEAPAQADPGESARFSTGISGAARTLRVTGSLDLVAARRFASALTELTAHQAEGQEVVVDLRSVPYVSPAAATVLAAAVRRGSARGVPLQVVRSPGASLALAGGRAVGVARP